jgi:hypothetical protein
MEDVKMNKLIILLLFVILPCSLFADFQVGPFAAYKLPISSDEDIPGLNELGLEDFWFGADIRIKASVFQGTLLGLFIPGNGDTVPNRMSVNVTGGFAFDLALLRLGVGLGPVWVFTLNSEDLNSIDFGTMLRLNADLMFGQVSIGLALATQINWTGEGDLFDFNNFTFLTGIALLFTLG